MHVHSCWLRACTSPPQSLRLHQHREVSTLVCKQEQSHPYHVAYTFQGFSQFVRCSQQTLLFDDGAYNWITRAKHAYRACSLQRVHLCLEQNLLLCACRVTTFCPSKGLCLTFPAMHSTCSMTTCALIGVPLAGHSTTLHWMSPTTPGSFSSTRQSEGRICQRTGR